MTHVSHPYGFRLGITKDWQSKWLSANKHQYVAFVKEDFYIREFLKQRLEGMLVSEILFERRDDGLNIIITSLKPGFIIGEGGDGIQKLITELKRYLKKRHSLILDKLSISVNECRYMEVSAPLIAEQIAGQLKRRMHHRKVMKQMIDKAISNRDVKGVRIVIGGRLNGAEIARSEELKKGNIPLQTLRSNISYASKPCILSYGTLGIKVWVYLGEISTDTSKANKKY